MKWSAPYWAYCVAHGYRDPPDLWHHDTDTLRDSRPPYPLWNSEHLTLFRAEHPEAFLQLPGDPPRLVDVPGYEEWMWKKYLAVGPKPKRGGFHESKRARKSA